jgi:hypothetical protein
MAKTPAQTASSSGYWENLRRKRRLEQEQKGELTQEGWKNLALGRLAGAWGLPGDIAEATTPPLVTPSASLKAKGMKPFPAGMTPGEMPPKDGQGLTYKYTSPYFAEKFGISPAELIAGDVMGPGAPVTAPVKIGKALASAWKGLDVADLAISPLLAGVFAGKRAKTLPKMSYDRARKLVDEGRNPFDIYKETGFWKGPEGDWRFEISDKDIKFKPEALKSFEQIMGQELLVGASGQVERLQRVRYAPITDVVDHPELFKAYPELKEYYIKVDPEGEWSGGFGGRAGGYQSGRGEKVPLPDGTEEVKPVIMLMAPTRESEIKRLEEVLSTFQENLKDYLENINLFTPGTDDFKETQKLVLDQEKAIAGIEGQLQKLRDGGQPDVTFNVKSVLTHELQHAVQDLENFPRGGSPRYAETYTRQHIEDIPKRAGTDMPEVEYNVRVRNQMLEEMYVLDRINNLQFLQRYINSDQPTRSARLIENNALSYELTSRERDWLGPRPSRRNKKKYGEYLRRKAQLFQAKILNRFFEEPEAIQRALQFMGGHEARKGNISQADAVQMLRTYNPEALLSPDSYFPVHNPGMNPDAIVQPNWLALGEKPVKNAISRLSRRADKYYADQGIKSEVEKRWKDFEEVRERGIHEPGFSSENEFYYRLAGEAEARAVQDRYRRAVDEDKLLVKDPIPFQQGFDEKGDLVLPGGSYDRSDEQLAFVYPRGQAPSIQAAAAINVPKSDIGFSSPALRAILGSQKEQMPKEMWLKYLKGNNVKDPELEFSGLGSWLKEQKGQVSKQQLEEYMTTQNQLKIEEVVYGGMDEDVLVQRYIQEQSDKYATQPIEQLPEFTDDINHEVDKLIRDWRGGYDLTSYMTYNAVLDSEMKVPKFNSETEAREFLENYVGKHHVTIDENGEFMRDSGGSIMFYHSREHAEQEIEYILESQARRMPKEEIEQFLGVPDSQKFYGPVKYGGGDLNVPGERENYRELVLYWDKPGGNMLPPGYTSSRMPGMHDGWAVYDEKGTVVNTSSVSQEKAIKEVVDALGQPGTESLWFGSHQFTDKPNPLLHIRFNERYGTKEIPYSVETKEKVEIIPSNDPYMERFEGSEQPFKVRIEGSDSHLKSFNTREEAETYVAQNNKPQERARKEKILFIEEIQSDIAKRGQKEGFKPGDIKMQTSSPKLVELEKKHDEVNEAHNKIRNAVQAGQPADLSTQEKVKELREIESRVNEIESAIETEKLRLIPLPPGTKVTKKKQPGGPEMWEVKTGEKFKDRDTFWGMDKEEAIANAKYFIRQVAESGMERGPFIMDTKDYMELGLKRMILWASDNGFDKVAWTTGKQQMQRYSLRKHVNKITYMPPKPGSDIYFTGAEDKSGNMISGYKSDGTLDEIEEIYGSEIAEKMSKGEGTPNPDDPSQFDLTGVDLELTDPKHFLMVAYDKTMKNVAQSLGKKYDARVGVGEVTVAWDYGIGDPIKEQVWTLNLSEKLKSAAKQGLPYMAAVPPGALLYQKQQERDRTPVNRAAARPLAMQANVQ